MLTPEGLEHHRREGTAPLLVVPWSQLPSHTSWYAPGGDRLVAETVRSLGT